MILLPLVAALLGLGVPARAAYDCRYLEGEQYATTDGSGLREEGFTSWMRHPSHGKVMVLAPSGWLEYEAKGLRDAEYHVFVRCLAWAQGTETDVLWDGAKVGRLTFLNPGTALKWSAEVGVVRGPGDHKLRLVADPKITQAPYIDVILLTTQAGYHPSDEDQDFESFVTDLPLLHLKTAIGEETVMPAPGRAPSPAPADFDIAEAAAGPLGIGRNEITVAVTAKRAPRAALLLQAHLEDGPLAEAKVPLTAAGRAEVKLACDALKPGKALLSVRLAEGDAEVAAGGYPVVVPSPMTVTLDEYAYPLGTRQALWKAAFTSRPEVTQEISVEVSLRRPGAPKPLESHSLHASGPTLEQPLALAALPRGRYTALARFTRGGKVMLEEERALVVFDPVPLDAWRPVKRTEARGDTVLVNGEPFLGRLLYHAAPDERTRNQGFNLVQCYGGDPNPLDSIQSHLDACAKVGLWGTVALFNNRYFLPGDHFDLDHLREAVARFKDHPATWAWDLIDEPEGTVSPERVAEAARLLRQLDPNHLVWVNLCQPDRATDYLESQGLWSFDCYPLPGLGPFGYLSWLKISDEKVRGKKPLGSALQTYAYPGGRMPTPDELRCIAYLHVLHGYKWFGYYSYYDGEPAGCLARDPVLWSATRALNGELRALAPAILTDAPWRPVAGDQRPEVFQAAEKTVGGRRYLVAVSGSRDPLRPALQVAGQRAKLLFEAERTVPLQAGVLRDDFGPYAVHVYVVE